MRVLRVFLTTLVVLALVGGSAYAAGRWWTDRADRPATAAADPTDAAGDEPGEDLDDDAADDPAEDLTASEAPPAGADEDEGENQGRGGRRGAGAGGKDRREPARPAPLLAPGDTGVQVRELQQRLFQLAWFAETTTGRYDAATTAAVRGFQAKRGFAASGAVDRTTWRRLVSMSTEPTHDQLFNVLHPGPALLAAGDEGAQVRDLQARLAQIAWLFGAPTGTYDATTVEAVRGFQAKRGIPVTGEVDQRTLDRLHAMTATPTSAELHGTTQRPGALDPRCETGRALCVDKSTNTLRWVVDGHVQRTFDVRFGSEELPTREGSFTVYRKSRDHVSSLFGTSMPFAMFFSGGQAVHYSPDFVAHGYDGASHGCVNVRDYDGIAALFDEVAIGDKVIVYWS